MPITEILALRTDTENFSFQKGKNLGLATYPIKIKTQCLLYMISKIYQYNWQVENDVFHTKDKIIYKS